MQRGRVRDQVRNGATRPVTVEVAGVRVVVTHPSKRPGVEAALRLKEILGRYPRPRLPAPPSPPPPLPDVGDEDEGESDE